MEEKNLGENKMGVMPVGKLLFTMSAPLVASMLFQALYNVVDSMFVAKLSQDALNAVSLAFPLQSLVIAFATGTGVGMNALLSRALGEKNSEKANKAANTGLFLYFCTALLFAVLGILIARPFFRLQTQNESIIKYGSEYIFICLGCSFAVFAQVSTERLLQSTGRTNLAMIPQITGALINMVVDPILIFGLFGAPRLEVKGAAIATVFGQTIATVIGFILNVKKNKEIKLSFKMIRRPDRQISKEIYKIGFPSIVMQAIGSVTTFCLNNILIAFTEAATAALGAYYKIQSFIFLPVFGMNNAVVPIVSYNYGANYKDRLRKTVKLSIISAVTIMTIGAILFEAIPGTLLSVFSPTKEMLEVGTKAFRIIGITFPVAGFCIVAGSVCQALRKPVFTLITSVCRQIVVLLPSAYLLSLTGKLDNVWFAFLIAEVMSLILSIFFLRKTYRDVGL